MCYPGLRLCPYSQDSLLKPARVPPPLCPSWLSSPYLPTTGGAVAPWQRIYCLGYYTLPGHSHRYRDWKKEGHGPVNLSDSIAQSCDVYYYELALKLGIDNIHDFMAGFGFGAITGIDVPSEKGGTLPSRAWKRARFAKREDQTWYPGETLITGIGQGYLETTPLQLAHASADMVVLSKTDLMEQREVDSVLGDLAGQARAGQACPGAGCDRHSMPGPR